LNIVLIILQAAGGKGKDKKGAPKKDKTPEPIDPAVEEEIKRKDACRRECLEGIYKYCNKWANQNLQLFDFITLALADECRILEAIFSTS
jgi:hypothetical protein